ncbi:MAG: outer membrane lipoprotein-sorting protein [Candidatus Bipolaricaulota bacterium]|nr:outer membrane lipoprotein-sorting protein [Candidatus Bipolaricaulota bacterium]
MRSLVISVLGMVVFGVLALGDEAELLRALDRARFLDSPAGQLTAVIRSEADGKVTEAEVALAFREIRGGSYVRIQFLRPADVAGQVFLVTPEGTYFWQPELAGPIRTSGAQAAFGDAAVGQLAGIRFADDYRIVARRDGELELRATRPAVPFQGVVVLLDGTTGRPRELRLLALTGIVLYRVFLTDYAELGGDLYVREQVVENPLLGTRTTLTITRAGRDPLPEEAFDPGRLGR